MKTQFRQLKSDPTRFTYGRIPVRFAGLSEQDITDAQAFSPFTAHLDRCRKNYPKQTLTVQNVNRNASTGKVLSLDVISDAAQSDGTQANYRFVVMSAFKTEIYLFKAAARTAQGRKEINYQSSGYFVLSSVKARASVPDQAFYGATAATLVREGETKDQAGQRKLKTETAELDMPEPRLSVNALNDQTIVYSTTMRGNVDVHLVDIDLDTKNGRDFWQEAQGRKGGDKTFGESTETQLIEVSQFLRRGSTLPICDAITRASVIWMDQEPALLRAVQRGLKPAKRTAPVKKPAGP